MHLETPLDCLCTVIFHIAHLIDALSNVLNVPLPHSIDPFELNGPTISPSFSKNTPCGLYPVVHHSTRDAYRQFCWITLSQISKYPERYEDYVINPSFPLSLKLLQANIIVLCLKSGVDAINLSPSCAMLLNLNELRKKLEFDNISRLEDKSIVSSANIKYDSSKISEDYEKIVMHQSLKDFKQQLDSSLSRNLQTSLYGCRYEKDFCPVLHRRSSGFLQNQHDAMKMIEDGWNIINK